VKLLEPAQLRFRAGPNIHKSVIDMYFARNQKKVPPLSPPYYIKKKLGEKIQKKGRGGAREIYFYKKPYKGRYNFTRRYIKINAKFNTISNI
jgi:hypothetical protein